MLASVRRSVMNDFLMDNDSNFSGGAGGGGGLFFHSNESDMQSHRPSLPINVILYCIFYAAQQTIILRNYDCKDGMFSNLIEMSLLLFRIISKL